jgi:lipoprotein-anchoring transpeptidase ErfK/SrfK
MLVLCAAVVTVSAAGCSSSDSTTGSAVSSSSSSASSTLSGSPSASARGSASPSAAGSPSKKHKKKSAGPEVAISSVAPTTGSTVGVAMPISIVFRQPVSPSLHKQVEKHLEVTTSAPVTAAWHWFGTRRVDLRPRSFWTPGTTVSLSAHLGSTTYTRHFTIGADVRTHVYVKKHKTVVTKNGIVIRTMRSNAGSPSWPSWTGTMAVVNKSRTVRMDSCSVHIACSPSDPNYYDLELPWDVRITWSGTFLHYSSGDPHPGYGNGSHGCVHLSLTDAEWFYNVSKPGDPVTVTGSPRAKADADNGYAGFNLSWSQWVAGSAMGQFTTPQA